MKTIGSLKILINSFSKLEKNWDSYDSEKITIESIITSNKFINKIFTDNNNIDVETIQVYPMRDGGIQIEIGDLKEVEILNENVKEIEFDSDFNVININEYQLI